MKYIIDKSRNTREAAEYELTRSPHIWSRTIPTTQGRHVLFAVADSADHMCELYRKFGVELTTGNLLASCGLSSPVVAQNGKRPMEHSVKIDPYYDVLVSVFLQDTGFKRGRQSIVRTIAHEAAHAARYLAAKELSIPFVGAPMTREYDEALAQWAGYLTQEFLDAMHLLKGHEGATSPSPVKLNSPG